MGVQRRWEPLLRGGRQPVPQAPMGHHPPTAVALTRAEKARGQRLVGGLAGAARPREDIGGAQRSAQAGQKSAVECKGKSRPDWVPHNKGPRRETVA